ncbi:MAG: cytochrome C biogenesis protein DipZ [Deltaproteobacteria bacterium CG11_big_fil_rev_8_21_14_0_20_47_16]|nr:MAG: cytochrome C biogenesis protein DipZ [Deltaproteobacteria bacterium CG11_big_fil_rev_8_21_14_0_20_47_16]
MILYLFAFLSGLVTIFAPCIWPILPLVLSSSATGGRSRPLGVTLGIVIVFSLLAAVGSLIFDLLGLNADVLRYLAIAILVLMGVAMLVPRIGAALETLISRVLPQLKQDDSSRTGFWGGFVSGAAIGLIWTPCAGPILATVIALSATHQFSGGGFALLAAYAVGVAIPLFAFATLGNVIFTRMKWFNRYTGRVQQVFGAVILLAALAIATNVDKKISVELLNRFPAYAQWLNRIESQDAVQKSLEALSVPQSNVHAPEITKIQTWFNSPPLTLAALRGKVVLVDFWTYTCINCIRTLPHVEGWYEKYKDAGLVIIGVHTPEFEFEKNPANVKAAIAQYGITYPVALDNNYGTWQAFSNRYWPAEYLIDAEGHIRHTHFGEGDYDETEQSIRALLKEAGHALPMETTAVADTTPDQRSTPETYLGSYRGNPDNPIIQLGGKWDVDDEYIEASAGASLELKFVASKVFLVIHPVAGKAATVKVLLDGQDPGAQSGADVKKGSVNVTEPRLYELINLQQHGSHTLKLICPDGGVQFYAFTFG